MGAAQESLLHCILLSAILEKCTAAQAPLCLWYSSTGAICSPRFDWLTQDSKHWWLVFYDKKPCSAFIYMWPSSSSLGKAGLTGRQAS
jgi:hypothetical protein